MNELINQRNLNLPDLSGLSREEQIRILREIKKICDEIEGKYGRWDEAARDEAQKKVEEIVPTEQIDYIELLMNIIDWSKAFEAVADAFSTGFRVNYASFMKSASGLNYKMSYKGARDAVKKLSGLSSGPLTNITSSLKKSLKHQFSMDQIFPGIGFFVAPAMTLIESALDLLFGAITIVRVISNVLSTLLFEAIKLVAGALIKGILAPFLGPFAWLLGWLVEITFDVLNMLLNIEELISNVIENIIDGVLAEVLSIINKTIRLCTGG